MKGLSKGMSLTFIEELKETCYLEACWKKKREECFSER